MKRIPRLLLWSFASLACAAPLAADDNAVFSFKGSSSDNSRQIEGTIVLNRSATRTATATGFTFESPVRALHYTESDSGNIVADFTFTPANPNSLTIVKGKKDATAFHLLVQPVPTDPPFPGPTAFIMDFAFDGAAPWGDWVPDRTITGAKSVSLGASDIYPQLVAIVGITGQEIAAIEDELDGFEAALGAVFNQPGFKLPGATPSERVTALVMAVDALGPGQKKQLYDYLNAAP